MLKISQVITWKDLLVEGNAWAGMKIQVFAHYGRIAHLRTVETAGY